jgi:hypothetical protein
MGDRPPPGGLAQANGQPQSLRRLALKLLGGAAAQQRERERDVRAGRDLQRLKLEHRTGRLPSEESRPGRGSAASRSCPRHQGELARLGDKVPG